MSGQIDSFQAWRDLISAWGPMIPDDLLQTWQPDRPNCPFLAVPAPKTIPKQILRATKNRPWTQHGRYQIRLLFVALERYSTLPEGPRNALKNTPQFIMLSNSAKLQSLTSKGSPRRPSGVPKPSKMKPKWSPNGSLGDLCRASPSEMRPNVFQGTPKHEI